MSTLFILMLTIFKAIGIVNFYIASDLKSSGKCRITSALKHLSYYTSFSFGLEKGNPFTEILNQGYLNTSVKSFDLIFKKTNICFAQTISVFMANGIFHPCSKHVFSRR